MTQSSYPKAIDAITSMLDTEEEWIDRCIKEDNDNVEDVSWQCGYKSMINKIRETITRHELTSSRLSPTSTRDSE